MCVMYAHFVSMAVWTGYERRLESSCGAMSNSSLVTTNARGACKVFASPWNCPVNCSRLANMAALGTRECSWIIAVLYKAAVRCTVFMYPFTLWFCWQHMHLPISQGLDLFWQECVLLLRYTLLPLLYAAYSCIRHLHTLLHPLKARVVLPLF